MNTIYQTEEFDKWLKSLKDLNGRAQVLIRINRAQLGNFGDVKAVGDGVYEMRIDFGPGYRVYYGRHGTLVYLLLIGGDKSTQQRDIRVARQLWDQQEFKP